MIVRPRVIVVQWSSIKLYILLLVVTPAIDVIQLPTMGDFWMIADHRGSIVRNHATLRDVAVIGGQSHDVLAVFGHVQKLAAILVNVGYLKMIVQLSYDYRSTVVRCRTIYLRFHRHVTF